MIEDIESKNAALERLLGGDDDRLPRLVNSEPRCLDGLSNPCGLCGIRSQIARTQRLTIAQQIAEVCCPDGKMPVEFLV